VVSTLTIIQLALRHKNRKNKMILPLLKESSTLALKLRERVVRAVSETMGDSILLSGGLDTSIVAAVAKSILQINTEFKAVTVILRDAPSPDLGFSKMISSYLNIPQQIEFVDVSQIERELSDVVSVLRSFDPMEIRNSVVSYIGMKKAKSQGCSKIMTGDASDELFGGYSFVFKQSEGKAREILSHLWEVMHFSSIPLARSLGIEARLPFLHTAVKEFAMHEIGFQHLVGKHGDEVFGKYILRAAFEDLLPCEITWRTKTPIEYGSGTTILPKLYSQRIKNSEFEEKRRDYFRKDGVRLRDKEQLKYYEIFRNVLGPPLTEDPNQRACPACTSNVPDRATFCITCGEYPI
jgi:asparagine synthase (glutamine-hydrolysing)